MENTIEFEAGRQPKWDMERIVGGAIVVAAGVSLYLVDKISGLPALATGLATVTAVVQADRPVFRLLERNNIV